MSSPTGFIGQGWIGKNYADDFEARGYGVVRYALEEPYCNNLTALSDCSVVFIAVPTPTTIEGFDFSIVADSLQLLQQGTVAVIKSTLLPGTTDTLQDQFPELVVLHSPEFLREASAAHDAANPNRNIIGIPKDTQTHRDAATLVLSLLPTAPYSTTIDARAAELVKYAGNCFLYSKVVFMNLLYDIAGAQNVDWSELRETLVADPRVGDSHTQPVHVSGHETDKAKQVRGAGGHCFIKDFEAFIELYGNTLESELGINALASLRDYNNHLLRNSAKDVDLLDGVYGVHTHSKK